MKYVWRGAALVAAAVTGLLCMTPATAQIQTVSVTGGQVRGVLVDGIISFKGIPFAAPPLEPPGV